MLLIEQVKCENSLAAVRIERKYVEDLNAMLNIQLPSRTKQEWETDNQEHIKHHKQRKYQNQKELIVESRRLKFDCPCGITCRVADKLRHERTNHHQHFYKQEIISKSEIPFNCKEWKNTCFACACGDAHTNSTKARHATS